MCKSLRTTVWFALVLGTLTLAAQENPANADKTPTFKANTDLVLVPVVVTKGSQPVQGLSKDNFVVEEDGKVRTIAAFEEIKPGKPKPKLAGTTGRMASNVGADTIPQVMTLIAIDGINTPLMSQEQARRKVLSFIAKNATSGQLLGVVLLTDKGVKFVQDFTADPRLLIGAMEKLTGQSNRFNAGLPVASEKQQSFGDSLQTVSNPSRSTGPTLTKDSYTEGMGTDDASFQRIKDQLTSFLRAESKAQEFQLATVINSSLDCFQQIAQGLAGYAGKKNVIWASAGFVYPLDIRQFQDQKYLADKYTRTMRMLADANVAVYPVDVHGIQIQAGADSTYTREDSWAGVDKYASYKNASLRIDTFRDFAERTGGRVFFDPTANEKAFEQIMAESQSYYMLGYYLDRQAAQPGWHKLKIKLRNADGSVQSRPGFFVVPPTTDPDQIRKADLSTATRAPFDYTGIPLNVTWLGDPVQSGGKKKANFELHVLPSIPILTPGQTTLDFDFVAVARTPSSDVGGQSAKRVNIKLQPKAAEVISADGISYKGSLELEPGDYEVRFLVRDNLTGRMGSVLAPLSVK